MKDSEYEGEGTMPSTVFSKPREAMKNGEILRTTALTGTEDTDAPLDPYFWQGGVDPKLPQTPPRKKRYFYGRHEVK